MASCDDTQPSPPPTSKHINNVGGSLPVPPASVPSPTAVPYSVTSRRCIALDFRIFAIMTVVRPILPRS